jgi:putative phosphoesterase
MSETTPPKKPFLVGVISDTHGRLHPSVVKAFNGVDLIVHAGDIGGLEILNELRQVAPVNAVRGNMDRGEWASALPLAEIAEIGEVLLYVLHDIYRLDLEPAVAGFSAVICGHSHQPSSKRKDGVLYLNPGSATQPRYNSRASVAKLKIQGNSLEVQFVELKT